MDIEKVASETPEKIITNKIEFKNEGPNQKEIENIISIFKFDDTQKETAIRLIKSLYKIILEKTFRYLNGYNFCNKHLRSLKHSAKLLLYLKFIQ